MYLLPKTDMALYSGILLRELAIFWGISSASSTNRTDNPQSRDFTKSLIYSGSSVGRLSESTTNNVFYKRDKDLFGLIISTFTYCSVVVVHKTMKLQKLPCKLSVRDILLTQRVKLRKDWPQTSNRVRKI